MIVLTQDIGVAVSTKSLLDDGGVYTHEKTSVAWMLRYHALHCMRGTDSRVDL